MKDYKVTVYVQVPFETYVKADSEKEAIEEALGRDLFVAHIPEDYKEEDWILGDVMEFPNLGEDEEPDVEEL